MLDFDVLILGGGITGLACAYELEKQYKEAGQGGQRIALLEKMDRLGGKLGSIYDEGFLVERSADALFLKKPDAAELALEIGMIEQIIIPRERRFAIAHEGRLLPVDPRFLQSENDFHAALRDTPLLSDRDRKWQKLLSWLPRCSFREQSLEKVLRRKYGKKLSKLLFEPLYAGIHAGEPAQLSSRALYPELHAPLDAQRRARADALKKRFGAPYIGFRFGIQSFLTTIEKRLQSTKCFLETEVTALEKTEEGKYRVTALCDGLEVQFETRTLVASIPSKQLARLFSKMIPELVGQLDSIPWSGNLVLTYALQSKDVHIPFPASGFLVPREEETNILAATFSSKKWEGRAQENHELLRVFFHGQPEDAPKQAFEALRKYVPVTGDPVKTWMEDWREGLPQYVLGHEKKLKSIARILQSFPNLHLLGSSYSGMSVSDCVRMGKELAQKMGREEAVTRSSLTQFEECAV